MIPKATCKMRPTVLSFVVTSKVRNMGEEFSKQRESLFSSPNETHYNFTYIITCILLFVLK